MKYRSCISENRISISTSLCIILILILPVQGCEEHGLFKKDYCKKYLGTWDFHTSVSKTRSSMIYVYSGESYDYTGTITKGSDFNTVNVNYLPDASKTNLKVEDDGTIINACDQNAPLHWSISCSGSFDGDTIFHFTNHEKSPPNQVVETVSEITGIRSDRNIPRKAPTVCTVTASDLASTSVKLNGTVNPNYLPTKVIFQYGPGEGAYFYNKAANQEIVRGSDETDVNVTITGLQSITTMHYRLKASNSYGITYSSDMIFTTL